MKPWINSGSGIPELDISDNIPEVRLKTDFIRLYNWHFYPVNRWGMIPISFILRWQPFDTKHLQGRVVHQVLYDVL